MGLLPPFKKLGSPIKHYFNLDYDFVECNMDS